MKTDISKRNFVLCVGIWEKRGRNQELYKSRMSLKNNLLFNYFDVQCYIIKSYWSRHVQKIHKMITLIIMNYFDVKRDSWVCNSKTKKEKFSFVIGFELGFICYQKPVCFKLLVIFSGLLLTKTRPEVDFSVVK